MLVAANIFQPLIDVFESVLKFFHNTGGISWGWSIVLLTVCVRAILVPLTFRQIKSMVRMQALAPQMKEIQAKYKQDKERQSQEMMKFYRENNVNPLGSCLPLVLQLPVFISLYYMLRQSLRSDICPQIQATYQQMHHTTGTTPCGAGHGASFLFIPDLTDKASGVVLVVLIILYVGSQLGSTLVMSSAATMDPMQRRLMLFLPLVFVLFVFRFPAGVLVYWITTNFWTMGQQYIVRKRVGPRMAVAGAGGRRQHGECVRRQTEGLGSEIGSKRHEGVAQGARGRRQGERRHGQERRARLVVPRPRAARRPGGRAGRRPDQQHEQWHEQRHAGGLGAGFARGFGFARWIWGGFGISVALSVGVEQELWRLGEGVGFGKGLWVWRWLWFEFGFGREFVQWRQATAAAT